MSTMTQASATPAAPAPAVSLLITGTPGGDWQALAQALAQAAGARGVAARVVDWTAADTAGPAGQDALGLVLVDAPARPLALACGPDWNPQALLDEWARSVRQLLRLAHRRPQLWRVIDVAEARRHPAQLAGQVGAWLGLDGLAVATGAPVGEPDPLAHWLARGLADALPSVRQLELEAHATSTPIGSGAGPERPDWSSLVQRYLALRAAVDEAQRTRAALQAAEQQLALARVQAAESHAQLGPAREQLAQAQQQLAALRSRPAAPDEGLQARLAAAESERDLLLMQLHLVQEELEQQFLQGRKAAPVVPAPVAAAPAPANRPATSPAGPAGPAVASFTLVAESTADPHRHVDLDLRQLSLPGRPVIPLLRLRLVEHHGRPGLLFWRPDAGAPLPGCWQANGREHEREFMLVVPRSAPGRACLDRMGTQDWQFVCQVAQLLRDLALAHPQTLQRWRAAACVLLRELQSMPARLRYDDLVVTSEEAADSPLQLRFSGVSFGTVDLVQVHVNWWPQQWRLHWLAPTDPAHVALAAWPIEGGALADRFELPVGRQLDGAVLRRGWTALSEADRDILLGLLDALPAAAHRLADTNPKLPPDVLEARARDAHRQARSALRQIRVRAFGKRLLARR